MIRGAYLPSLRVQTAPFGRCWDVIVFSGVTDVKGPKPGLAFSFLSEFQETKKNCWMRVMSTSSVIIDLKIQQQWHVTVSPYAYLQFPLHKKSNTKDASQQQKKHKNPKAPFARHHAIIQAAPQIVSYFSETHTFPTPKTKKNSRLLPWPIGCQTLPHRPPDIMMPQRQKCPPRSTQRHRVRVRGSVDPPTPPDTSGADLMDGLNGGTGIVFFFVRRGTTTTAKLDHKKKIEPLELLSFL